MLKSILSSTIIWVIIALVVAYLVLFGGSAGAISFWTISSQLWRLPNADWFSHMDKTAYFAPTSLTATNFSNIVAGSSYNNRWSKTPWDLWDVWTSHLFVQWHTVWSYRSQSIVQIQDKSVYNKAFYQYWPSNTEHSVNIPKSWIFEKLRRGVSKDFQGIIPQQFWLALYGYDSDSGDVSFTQFMWWTELEWYYWSVVWGDFMLYDFKNKAVHVYESAGSTASLIWWDKRGGTYLLALSRNLSTWSSSFTYTRWTNPWDGSVPILPIGYAGVVDPNPMSFEAQVYVKISTPWSPEIPSFYDPDAPVGGGSSYWSWANREQQQQYITTWDLTQNLVDTCSEFVWSAINDFDLRVEITACWIASNKNVLSGWDDVFSWLLNFYNSLYSPSFGSVIPFSFDDYNIISGNNTREMCLDMTQKYWINLNLYRPQNFKMWTSRRLLAWMMTQQMLNYSSSWHTTTFSNSEIFGYCAQAVDDIKKESVSIDRCSYMNISGWLAPDPKTELYCLTYNLLNVPATSNDFAELVTIGEVVSSPRDFAKNIWLWIGDIYNAIIWGNDNLNNLTEVLSGKDFGWSVNFTGWDIIVNVPSTDTGFFSSLFDRDSITSKLRNAFVWTWTIGGSLSSLSSTITSAVDVSRFTIGWYCESWSEDIGNSFWNAVAYMFAVVIAMVVLFLFAL